MTGVYTGDAAGICGEITPAGDTKDALRVSLTHLRVAPSHPRYRAIQACRRERVRRLRASQQ
jgi:hypothetical protein